MALAAGTEIREAAWVVDSLWKASSREACRIYMVDTVRGGAAARLRGGAAALTRRRR